MLAFPGFDSLLGSTAGAHTRYNVYEVGLAISDYLFWFQFGELIFCSLHMF